MTEYQKLTQRKARKYLEWLSNRYNESFDFPTINELLVGVDSGHVGVIDDFEWVYADKSRSKIIAYNTATKERKGAGIGRKYLLRPVQRSK